MGSINRTHRIYTIALLATAGLAGSTARAQEPYPRRGWQAELSTLFHNVSGTVTIIDERTLHVSHFTYDGGGPAVYFYLGTQDTPAAFQAGLSVPPLLTGMPFNDEPITLTLPVGETLDGYEAVSVWCADFNVNFGSGTFAPPDPEYARAGWEADLPNGSHQVQGLATLINENLIHVTDFTYDGGAPAVYFYLGERDEHSSFMNGLEVPPLLERAYADESLVLEIPDPDTARGYRAISVWCAAFDINFSSASFEPPSVDLPLYADFSDCLVGPDSVPSPPAPLQSQDCLDMFDQDFDGDCDTVDFRDLQEAFPAP